MSPTQKKARVSSDSSDTQRNAVSTTQSGQKLIDLLDWLKSNGTTGLEDGRFDFLSSDGQCGGSLGGFAAKDYTVGEVLFSIPLTCIISLSNAKNTKITTFVREAAKAFSDTTLVTSELLIWLFMIQQLDDSNSHFSPFVHSLDSESPSPLSWPKELAAALIGTNMSTMTSSFSLIEKHSKFLNETRRWAKETNRDCSFLSAEKFNLTSLIWARGHYLARRYPGKFSISDLSSDSSIGDNGDKGKEGGGLSTTVRSLGDEGDEAGGDGREMGMMNLGAMVPLLDILNHNPEREWLTFKVVNGCLDVTCNYPVSKGSEVYSNYGSLSNEMLLFAYGFCLESNSDDAITLQLMGMEPTADSGPSSSAGNNVKHFGTYYVRGGGMAGVPNELWRQLTSSIGEDIEGEEEDDEGERDDEGEEGGDEGEEGGEEGEDGGDDEEEGKGGRNIEGEIDAEGEEGGVDDDDEGGMDEELEAAKEYRRNMEEKTATSSTEKEEEGEDQEEGEEEEEDDNDDSNNNDDGDDDEDDIESAVEVGIEECEMLVDCLQKKLDLLLSTQDSAASVLASFGDTRAQYVQWYRDGQLRILREAIEALNEVIGG